MKPASSELLALLATRQFFAADLYTFAGGALGPNVLTYCGGDADVIANGVHFAAGGVTGPYFDRKDNKAKCHWKTGVEADTLVFDVLPGSAQLFGTPFAAACRSGVFYGAELTLERAFMPVYGDTSRGLVRMFVGRVAEIDAGRSICTFSVKSHLELLDIQMPRNLYQAPCPLNLGDGACGVNLSLAVNSGVVTAGSTEAVINATITGGPFTNQSRFNQGKITFTSGALSGLSAGVKSASYAPVVNPASVIALNGFLPSVPALGDTFNIFLGCNKSLTSPNGCPKFTTTFGGASASGNQSKFQGEPFIPVPVTAA